MRRVIFIAAALLFAVCLPNLVQAQGEMRNFNPEEVANRQTQMMKDSLNLTEEQIPKVQAINLAYAQKMKKVMDSDMERMEKFQEIQVMQTNKIYEINKVLTKEQGKKYRKMEEERRAKMMERRRKE
jgi:Spy/CpxP family protein refolding chaperone